MGLVDEIMEAIVAIFLIIVFFGLVFPSMSQVTGISTGMFWIIGVLLIIAVILSLTKR
jgi:protein-S-isoprenylcysteine O-methyltransferase Ste14